ncbi:hypothetical protein ACX122_10995 [Kosakonia cowanii]|mgnify:CR=1 FL=1|uniref:hypothetical protein n=1 Tax=Kosakonia sp. HypNH10 TaxID=2980101 RepID=UPI00244B4792|nr:hypothetical protein [Kosakonia sp. HypNH10]MDH2912929.1 hypothetical protein [Kosakonia sp. HypNH10]
MTIIDKINPVAPDESRNTTVAYTLGSLIRTLTSSDFIKNKGASVLSDALSLSPKPEAFIKVQRLIFLIDID